MAGPSAPQTMESNHSPSAEGRGSQGRPSNAVRVLGRLISAWAAATIVAYALGLLLLPPAAGGAAQAVRAGLTNAAAESAGMGGTLRTAADGLAEASATLEETSATLRQVRRSLEDSEPLLDSVGRLVGDDAPTTLESTRDAILATRSGAQAIDQVLRALSRVSFLTGVRYDPDEALDESLAGVAEAIGPLPDSLRAAAGDLDSATAGLREVELGLTQTADEMRALAISMQNLSWSLDAQGVEFDRIAAGLQSASDRATGIVTVAAGVLALLLIGASLTQTAVLMLGRSLTRGELGGDTSEQGTVNSFQRK